MAHASSLPLFCVFCLCLSLINLVRCTNCTFGGVDLAKLDSTWNSMSGDGNITYKISLCKAVVANGHSDQNCHGDTSVCMHYKNGTVLSAGNFSTETKTSQGNDKGELWLVMTGDPCLESPTDNMSTLIGLKCGPTMGGPKFLEHTYCVNYFIWETDVMCTGNKPDFKEVKCYLYDDDGNRFDLSPLAKKKGGYHAISSDSQTEIYINVCRDIAPDGETANCPNGSGACVKVTTGTGNNVTVTTMSGGTLTDPLRMATDKRLTLHYGSDTKPDQCTYPPSTTVNFVCPLRGGSKDPIIESDFNCQYVITWETEYACPEATLTNDSCILTKEKADIDIDLTPLRKPSGSDHPYKVNYTDSSGSNYIAYINICEELNIPCPDEDHQRNIAVCQLQNKTGHSMGSIHEKQLRYADGDLTLTYKGGDKCHHNNQQRSTIINFVCNKTAVNDGKGEPVFSEEDDCTYIFDWGTKYACTEHPVGEACDVSYGGNNYDLSRLVMTEANWVALQSLKQEDPGSYFINVCHDVLSHMATSGCKQGSAICYKDGSVTKSLGQYASAPVYQPDSESIQLTYTNGDSCGDNKHIFSVINFYCKPGHLESRPTLVRKSADSCLFEFEWQTAAACKLGSFNGSDCKVSDATDGFTFDLSPLKKDGEFYKVTNGKDHDFLLNVCGPLTGTKCDSANITNPGICQVKKEQENSEAYVIGQYNSHLKYFDGLIKLIYNGGTPYHDTAHTPRAAEIAFLCNSTVGIGAPKYMSELNHTYLFEWYTSYACPEQAIECTATDADNEDEYDLSALSYSAIQGNWIVEGGNYRTYYINVCRKLNRVKVENGCSPSAAVCRTKLENGQEKIDVPDMGHVTSGLSIKDKGQLELTYTSTAMCNGTSNYVTHLQFVCVQSYTVPSAPRQDGPCEYTIIWNTPAACPLAKEVETESCTIKDPNSDYVFSLQPLTKKDGFYNVTGQDTTFKLNICGNLSSEVCGSDSTVCSIAKDGTKTVLSSKSGRLQFSEAGHMSLLYEGAQRMMSSGQNIDVIINFECDRSIAIGTPENLRKDTALYIFTFKTALACPPTPVECLVRDSAGHEYDLSTMYRPSGWTAYDSAKGQTYYINVCRPISNLNWTVCPAGPIGGCQVASNGNAYNMGYIQSKPVASPDGTLSLRYMNGDLCHKGTPNEAHRSTRINFFCSGVNGGLTFLTETETCEYVFMWNTPAACPLQKRVGDQCKVMEPLFNFQFNLNPLRKAAYDYHVKNGDYEYVLNVCGPLNANGVCGTQTTASCQRKPNDDSFTPVDAGKANSTLVYSGGELTLTMTGGQDNCHGTYTRKTVITFKCDHSTDGKNGSLRFIEETANCQYLFDWPTRFACPPFHTGQCSLKGPDGAVYDLTSLGRTNDNYETTDTVQRKRYVINVCRSLVHKKDATCPYNAAACMIDTNATEASTKYHNIGQVNDHQVQFINGKLLIIYESGEVCAKNNSDRYTTHIHLKCDKNAQESSPTGHFMVGDCAHHFMWSTPAACPISGTKPVPTTNVTCKLTSPTTGSIFDLSELKVISGKPWSVSDGDNHIYEFNVCGGLVGSACGNASSLMGACQSEISGQKRTYNAGNVVSDIYYDYGIVILNYTGGDRCHNGQYQRNTIISFVCSKAPGIGEPVYVDETLDCTYYISWHTKLVCESEIKCTVDVDDRTLIDLSPLGNMPYQLVTSAEKNELYYISVCQPLKPIPGTLCPAGASACLVLPGIKQHMSLGKPRSAPTWDKENQAVVMVYANGTKCDENPALNYSTRIIFKCKPGPHRGTPVLVTIANCEYVFQWDTNVVCYDETPSEPTDFCGYRDPQTLETYNFTTLHAPTPYEVTGKDGKKFLINMCGPAEPTSTSSCNHAMVCSDGISYGEPKNYQVEKESGGFKLNYAGGEKCADGTTAQSYIRFSCDRSGLGQPEFSTQVGCYLVFTWKTSAVCPPVEDTCFSVINGHLYDLSLLTRDTGSWTETDADGNKYWINVCASVHGSPCDNDVGVCQLSKGGKPVSLGRASTAKELKMKNGTLTLEYSEGGPACTQSKRRSNNQSAKTVINFKCGKTYGGPVFIPRKNNADDCVFEFDWETKLACQVKKEEVHDVGGMVTDPRSGGVINLNPLLHKSFEYNKSDTSGGMMTYKIQLNGKSAYCKDGVVCQQRNNKNQYRVLGMYTQRKLYIDDDILEVEYNSTEFCKDSQSQRPVSSVIQFRCNKNAPLNSGPELLYSSKDCMYVFSWETRVACLNATVVIPSEGPAVKGHSEGSSGGMQPKTIGAIVGVFLGAIIICILLVVFHSADRRAAFVNRLRRVVGHKSSEYTQLPSESSNLLEDEEDVLTFNDPAEPDTSRETEPIVTVEPQRYHDDSDEDLLA